MRVAELIVGVTTDPLFGLVMTVGIGGVLVELLKDSRTLCFRRQRRRSRPSFVRCGCSRCSTAIAAARRRISVRLSQRSRRSLISRAGTRIELRKWISTR